MSAGSPGEDSGGEPVPAEDPWSRPADFGQPGPAGAEATSPAQPAQQAQPGPLPSDPRGFVSPAPAAWSAPVDWTPPAPADPSAEPTQSGQQDHPVSPTPSAESPPPAPSAVAPPPAGPYGYPSAAYPTPATMRTNRLAIAALVCGLAQFFLGLFALNFLLAIPAIICGAIGMRQTRERGEGGRGLSIAGVVLGILGIVWNVLYVVLIIALTKPIRP